MFMVATASTPEALEQVRRLFLAYANSLGISLEFQGFSLEVAELPGAYAPPRGCLLLATDAGTPAGCVALRPAHMADDGRPTGEVKRLYIAPPWRGQGLGLRLGQAVIAQARAIGYERLVLDTLPEMQAAQAVYRKLGFTPIAPYYPNPIAGTAYLGLSLEPAESLG